MQAWEPKALSFAGPIPLMVARCLRRVRVRVRVRDRVRIGLGRPLMVARCLVEVGRLWTSWSSTESAKTVYAGLPG